METTVKKENLPSHETDKGDDQPRPPGPAYGSATAWMKSYGFFVSKTHKYTHLLLDGYGGGRVYIEEWEDLCTLYAKVAEDSRAGGMNFIVEQKPEDGKFPLLLDLDCVDDTDMGETAITEWLPRIQEVVGGCARLEGYDLDHTMIVCRAPPKVYTDKEGAVKTKTGFHIHFPHLPVDKESARLIRSLIVEKLQTELGERPPANPWTAVVDRSVLEDNGIRILWSWKCTRCPTCMKAFRDKTPAPLCGPPKCDRSKIYDRRVYTPWGVVGCDGRVQEVYDQEEVLKDPRKYLLLTSVRRFIGMDCPRLIVTPPPSYDAKTCVTSTEKERGKRKGQVKLKTEQAKEDARRLGFHRDENAISPASPRHTRVVEAVHLMDPSVVVCSVRKSNVWFTAQTNTKVKCRIAGREHSHNRVWYSVSPEGVSQRCYDEECRGKKSDPTPMPPELRSALFPFSSTLPLPSPPLPPPSSVAATRIAPGWTLPDQERAGRQGSTEYMLVARLARKADNSGYGYRKGGGGKKKWSAA